MMFEPLTFVSLLGKSRWCNYFSGRLSFLRKKQTFRLRGKSFSVFIFMKTEMFSEELEGSSNLAISATELSVRDCFRTI